MKPEPQKYIVYTRRLSRTLSFETFIGDNRAMELLVYSATWCRDCREAKRFLTRHAIPYTEIDIEATPGAAQEVIAHTGKRAIPQFVIDGKWVQPYKPGQGFLHDEMAVLFGVAENG